MRNIKNYEMLCKEIERVKESIEKVKNGSNYEQGDDFDLTLYLIQLKKAKVKADREWVLLKRIGATKCEKCGKLDLTIEEEYKIPLMCYSYTVKCNDCGHIKVTQISHMEFQELVPIGEYDWVFID